MTHPDLIALRDTISVKYQKFLKFERLQLELYNSGLVRLAERAGEIAREIDRELPGLVSAFEELRQEKWFEEKEKLL